MGAAAIGVAQKEDDEQRIDEQDIFDRMVLVLAALTVGLCSSVLGADDAPLRPIMGTRGDAGVATGAATTGGGSSTSGVSTVAASASVTPRRCARAASERAGASPRVHSAANSTGKRMWIPLMGFALTHPEQAPLHDLEAVRFQGGQAK